MILLARPKAGREGIRVAATTPTDYLFVYGTLREASAHPMHRCLQPATFRGLGSFPGALYNFGAYPGAVAVEDSADNVLGELYLLHESTASLARLDEYEGCTDADPPPHEYARVVLPIRMSDSESILAWVYLYNRPVAGLTRVPSGDWLRKPEPVGASFTTPATLSAPAGPVAADHREIAGGSASMIPPIR